MPTYGTELVSVNQATIVDVIRSRAVIHARQNAFLFVRGAEASPRALTYTDLDRQARGIAVWLQKQDLAGERVLIAQPQGLEYITALLGCFYAGAVAIPVFPPKLNRHLRRLQMIVKDATPSFALTSSSLLAKVRAASTEVPELGSLHWVTPEETEIEDPDNWEPLSIRENSMALLQYTSGSTGDPRGVMVTHANLMANQKMIQEAFGVDASSVIVGWLPLYHDMGLIGNILQPLWAGAQCVLMSPTAFVEHPARWLKLISEYHGTISGGPNFAYELCCQRISAEERARLDLSSWRTAFTGSEPVSAETLDNFTRTFARCGFKASSWFPCYGLAEATLFVSGGKTNSFVQREISGKNTQPATRSKSAKKESTAVSCGPIDPKEEVLIVDADTLRICQTREVGEIWVAGPNIAQGYWNQEAASQATFGAFLCDGRGPFLRTGDLGFLSEEQELFITGRMKDLIIIRGRNHYPQDLESTVRKSHRAFHGGSGAAFWIETEGRNELIVLQEVTSKDRTLNFDEVVEAAATALAEEHEVRAHLIGLVHSGELPRTTSGKIRRHECKRQLMERELKLVAANRKEFRDIRNRSAAEPNGESDEYLQVAQIVRKMAAQVLRISPAELDIDKPLTAFGLDSIQAGDLKARIAEKWKVDLSWELILDRPTAQTLAKSILAAAAERGPGNARKVAIESSEFPLSLGQRALWLLNKLAPDSTSYNIPVAIRIRGTVNDADIQAAFQFLINRHAALRTVFASGVGGPVQTILPELEAPFVIVPAADWSEEELAKHITKESARPFALEEAPLLRVTVFDRSENERVLLLVIQHAITDFHSLIILLGELQTAYALIEAGLEPYLPPVEQSYAEFVDWQEKMLTSHKGEQLRKYWQEQLAGELPVLKLPIDHARPPAQTFSGSIYRRKVGASEARKLLALSESKESSLYTLMAAAFMTLLHRYTCQKDIVVGTPVSGRTQACWNHVTGYFVNQVVLRAQFSHTHRFSDLWEQVRNTVRQAIVNQDYPLALVADQLHPERTPGYPPLFQTMISFHRVSSGSEGLAGLAVGEGGYSFNLGSLKMESVRVNHNVSQLDLTLAVAQIEDELALSIQYNSDLFERDTIARMAGHFGILLEGIINDVDRPISELSLLTRREEAQLLFDWNQTALPQGPNFLIHKMFEQQARIAADRTAVVSAEQELTYAELEDRANQLAHYLISLGAGPDVAIGLCLERSADMMIGLLGILKAGAAYLPIDPGHPQERVSYLLADSQAKLIVSQSELAPELEEHGAKVVCIDSDPELKKQELTAPTVEIGADNLAYVMYTSASTGKPKGVMIAHRSVANFMESMDKAVGCGKEDTMLAVTSIGFDISVLELLWTLTRGTKVIVADGPLASPVRATFSKASVKDPSYSLFYFASADEGENNGLGKYRLLLEGARYADKNDFAAVWTPERHFHSFGGLYPNPSVTSAALAAVTRRIQVRAGSVVLPLHNVLRVAEEWSVVDNISGGRTGIAFASGWHADDFVLAPCNYHDRKEITFQSIETFLKLWRGESMSVQNSSGKEIEIKIFPRPVQQRPPVWITAAGTTDTFVRAGEMGANVLTHLLGQSMEELGAKIKLYRDALVRSGHSPNAGQVTLMLHTFIGEDLGRTRDIVRKPFTEYLRSSVDLINKLVVNANLPLNLERMSATDMDDLLAYAFDRYFETSALFGTFSSCAPMIERLKRLGIDEIACLVDFGVDAQRVLGALKGITALKQYTRQQNAGSQPSVSPPKSLRQLIEEHKPTMMQGTPTMVRALESALDGYRALDSLRVLMLGGEPLPHALAAALKKTLSCRLVNMYGPTETTIWSSTDEVEEGKSISIGRPIANTEFYLLDSLYSRPVPVGVIGELHIGGDGLARGYLQRPELTAERFVPDEFSGRPGARLYRTGDLGRYLSDGRIDLVGRNDSQVKVRGVRIEMGEVESALCNHPGVKQAAVMAHGNGETDKQLVAYIVPKGSNPPVASELRTFLKTKLPHGMVPSEYLFLDKLPVNANGKLNRKALPAPDPQRSQPRAAYAPPVSEYEVMIVQIWKQVLALPTIGIDDNFFDLGGHSLRIIQVQGQLSARLQKEIPLIKLFEHPTVRSLARHLADEPIHKPVHRDKEERANRQRQAMLRHKEAFSAARRSIQ